MAAMLETPSTSAPEASPGCDVLAPLHSVIERLQADVKFKQAKIEALNFEIARLKRWRFGSSSESLDNSAQTVLFDLIVTDTREEDAAAAAASPALPATPPALPVALRRAVRKPFPADLPCIDHHHEIQDTHCACGQVFKRVGEEISEQLDCVPAQFFVQRHIRGKYACACCQTIQAAPMPAQIIDKGIPAPGLLAPVVIAKHDDPNFQTIGRCTPRKRSTSASAGTPRARAWRSGSASAACGWPRWLRRCASSSLVTAWSTPTRRRCSC